MDTREADKQYDIAIEAARLERNYSYDVAKREYEAAKKQADEQHARAESKAFRAYQQATKEKSLA